MNSGLVSIINPFMVFFATLAMPIIPSSPQHRQSKLPPWGESVWRVRTEDSGGRSRQLSCPRNLVRVPWKWAPIRPGLVERLLLCMHFVGRGRVFLWNDWWGGFVFFFGWLDFWLEFGEFWCWRFRDFVWKHGDGLMRWCIGGDGQCIFLAVFTHRHTHIIYIYYIIYLCTLTLTFLSVSFVLYPMLYPLFNDAFYQESLVWCSRCGFAESSNLKLRGSAW